MLTVAATTAHIDRVVFADEGCVRAAASHQLHLEVNVDFFGEGMRILITMTQLATGASAPSVNIALFIDVSRVVLTDGHIAHLLEECLDASGMVKDDGVESWDSQLTIAIVTEGIQLFLVVHNDSVMRSTKHLHNINAEVELAGNRAVSEVASAQLALLVAAPGVQFAVLRDTRGVLKSARHLFDLLAFNIDKAELRAVSNRTHRVSTCYSCHASGGILLLEAKLAVLVVSEHEKLAVDSDSADMILAAAHLLELLAVRSFKYNWLRLILLESMTLPVDKRAVARASPENKVAFSRDCR